MILWFIKFLSEDLGFFLCFCTNTYSVRSEYNNSYLPKSDKYHHLVVEHSLLLLQDWPQPFHFFVNGQTRFTTNIFNARVASEDSRFIQLREWAPPRTTSFSKARLHSHTPVGHHWPTLHFGMFSFDRVCFFLKLFPRIGPILVKTSSFY